MRRWMLVTFTAAAFGLGLSVSADQPPVQLGLPNAVVPPAMATAPAMNEEGAVWVAPAGSCSTCGPKTKVGQKIAGHFNKLRPEPDCFLCASLECEWRFLLGGCHAYFGVGRFGPPLPVVADRP